MSRGQSSNEIVYVYDELGRLVAVIDTASEAAVYSYDAVGNLLSISRYSASTVSIIEFTPNSGPVGATVTIYGTGFSVTPSQNSVTFNGVAATITSATATKIITTVPVGATTGPIAITTPAGSATSSTSFVVGDAGLPAITDFSPTIAVAGTPVTITGTNFEPTAGNNKSKFNVTLASITSATSTSIATTVPAGGTSGRISVSTPAGTAVSSNDFFVPPAPYTAADVASTGRMAYSESKSLTLGTANKIGLVVFDGVAGQRASINVTSSTISSTVLTVYSPTGVAVGSATVNTSGGYLETSILPTTGTYTILIDPSSTYTGNISFALYNANDLTGTITINGPAVALNIGTIGQNAKLTFSGTAGQRVSVGLSDMTLGVGYCCDVGSVSILNPNGTALLLPYNFGNGGAGTPSVVLPATGTYTIFIDPFISRTGNITVTLSEDLASPVTINGSAVNLTYRAGQNAFLPFSGTAGQRVSVGLSDMTLATGYCCDIGTVAIYKPDGTVLLSPYTFTNGGAGTPSVVLPTSGNYAILIDPYVQRSGNMTVTLSEDLAPTITINGAAVTSTYRAGQNARLTFSGTAGQRVSVGLSDMTLATGYCCDIGTVAIYKPDGTVLLSPYTFTNGGAGTPSVVLPTTGTYSIVIDPYVQRSGDITVTLSEDLASPVTINGSAVTLTYRAGQNAFLPFSGTAGQRVSVGLSDMTLATGYCCDIGTVAIYKPDGTVLLSPYTFTNGGAGTPSVVLPTSGNYAILIDPYVQRSGNMTVTLSEDLAPTITINGAAVTSTYRAGQNARLTFSGTAGQRVSVGLSDMTLATGYCCDIGTVAIYKPDGTVLLSPYTFTNGGAGTPSVVLPTTGTYSIVIDPYVQRSGDITVTLSEDLASPVTINGSAVTLTYRTGQNAFLPFSGTAGQRVSVGLSDMTLATGYCCDIGTVAIYKPDGTVLLSPYTFTNGGAGTPSVVLPTSGNYAILIDPYVQRSGNMTVTLSEDLAPTIAINGAAVSLTYRTGQNARLTFSGTAGQRVSVGLSDMTLATGYCCDIGTVAIYKPDGTVLLSPYTFTNGGAGTPSVVLPTTGTYSIVIDPYVQRSGDMTVTLSEDLAPPISISGPTVSLTYRTGQNARLTFDGTAGQRVSVGLSDMTLATGYCCDIGTVAIYKPDGTALLSPATFTNGGVGTSTVVLPTTGTYSIVIDPYVQRSGNMAVTLSEDLAPALTINASALTLQFNRVGLNAYASFSGTSGQQVTVRITNNLMGNVTVKLLKPDGTQVTSSSSSSASFNLATQTLSTTGTYRIVIDPNTISTQSLGISVTSP